MSVVWDEGVLEVGRKSPPSPHQRQAVPRGSRGLCLHGPPMGFVRYVLLLGDFDDLMELEFEHMQCRAHVLNC